MKKPEKSVTLKNVPSTAIKTMSLSILDRSGYSIARVSKELFHMTDTYVIDVQDPGNALDALMFVLAIDAEKCSRN